MIRARPLVVGVLAWVVGATASVAVGLLALSLIGADLTGTGDPPIVADTVGDAPAPPSSSPGPATSGPASPGAVTGTTAPRRLNSAGGYVLARCQGAGVYLVAWGAAAGYRVRDVDRGPSDDARIRFENDDRRVEMRVTCAGGEPVAAIESQNEGGSG